MLQRQPRSVSKLETKLKEADLREQIRATKMRTFISVALPCTLILQICVFDVLVVAFLMNGTIDTSSGVLETFIGSMLLHFGALVMVVVKHMYKTPK